MQIEKFVEDLVWYDGPLVFTFEYKEDLFLAYIGDIQPDYWRYIVVPADNLEDLLTDKVTIREWLNKSKCWYLDSCNGGEEKFQEVNFADIPDDCLPKEGIYLRLNHV